MRRWEVPIDEITELLAADLGHSCISIILYQNWNNNTGPSKEKSQHANPSYAELAATIQQAIENEKIEKSLLGALLEKLAGDAQRYHEGIRRSKFANIDLDEYEAGIKERFQMHLDGQGVEAVFQTLQSTRKLRLARIEDSIHKSLRSSLNHSTDPVGLAYHHDVLITIQQRLRESSHKMPALADNAQSVRHRMQRRTIEWHKMTVLSRPFRQEQLSVAHREDALDLLRQELRHRVAKEDSELLELVTKLLGSLASDYRRAFDFLSEKSRSYAKRRDQLMQELHDLKASENGGNGAKIANRAELSLKDIEQHLSAQRLEQALLRNTCTSILERAIFETLGNDHITKIGRFSEAQNDHFEKVVDIIIYEQVKQIHDVICQRDYQNPVLTGDVLDILQKRYNEDPERFKTELKGFIDSSASSLRLLTGSEIQPAAIRQDGGMPPMPREAMVIGLPSNHPFSRTLQNMIAPLMSAGSITANSIYYHDDPTQIRMLTLTYWMAARFASVVHELEKIYRRSLQADSAGDKRYFTNLDDSGENANRPPLLLPTPEQAKRSTRAALWLGTKVMAPGTDENLIQVAPEGVKLIEITKRGIQTRLIGTSIQSLKLSPDIVTASLLNDSILAAIASMNKDALNKLHSQVLSEDSRLRASKGVNSPEYDEWTTDRNQILDLLEQ